MLTFGSFHLGSLLEVILEPILDHFWIHLGTLGDFGGSKWTSKGSWKVFRTLPTSRLQNILEEMYFWRFPEGVVPYRGLMGHTQVLDTLGPLGRVPACTGAHFRNLLFLVYPVGKGFLKKNQGFRKDFRKKEGV